MSLAIKDAPTVWNLLNGVFCVYKPSGFSFNLLKKVLQRNIADEMNELKCRPPIAHVSIDGDTTKQLHVEVKPSFADNPLVVGPRYIPEDVRCCYVSNLYKNSSGVMVLGLNNGMRLANELRANNPMRTYRLMGRLGESTDTYFKDGKIVERSTYRHVKQSRMAAVLNSIQATHQKKMFELCGVDMQSQAAYELAAQGPIRPDNHILPVIYGIKCVAFSPPDFTIEVQSINEYEDYLLLLIHDLGLALRTSATCVGLQCIRFGAYGLDQALLKKHWTVQHIVENVRECNSIAAVERERTSAPHLVALNQRTGPALQHTLPGSTLRTSVSCDRHQ